jgi:hypothetical protein
MAFVFNTNPFVGRQRFILFRSSDCSFPVHGFSSGALKVVPEKLPRDDHPADLRSAGADIPELLIEVVPGDGVFLTAAVAADQVFFGNLHVIEGDQRQTISSIIFCSGVNSKSRDITVPLFEVSYDYDKHPEMSSGKGMIMDA